MTVAQNTLKGKHLMFKDCKIRSWDNPLVSPLPLQDLYRYYMMGVPTGYAHPTLAAAMDTSITLTVCSMAESKNSLRNSCKVFYMAVVLSWQSKFSLCNSRITVSTVVHLQLHLQQVCCMAKTPQPHAIAPASSVAPSVDLFGRRPPFAIPTGQHGSLQKKKQREKHCYQNAVNRQSHAGPCRQPWNMIEV